MKRFSSPATLALFALLMTLPSFSQLQEPTQPVNVIIDSDMSLDADDVGDHAVLWGLQNRHEVNVLALIASSANDYSAPAMRAIASYYGHPEVPVGAHKGATPTADNSANSPYAQRISIEFGTPGDTRFNYPDAVTVYRQALANAADGSVYIISNGYFQPLQALLQSGPDGISPLTGLQLVAQKVRRFVCSAGWFSSGNEHNFNVDPDAASYVFANWPGEIVSTGAQMSWDTNTGPSASSDPTKDPVKRAYNLQGVATTPAWGQLAVLYAIRGLGSNFSVAGYNGQTVVDPSTGQFPGSNFWSPSPNKGHSYLQKAIPADTMAAIINPLLQSSSNMPILRSISPATLTAGGPAQSITLNGSNFFSDSQALFNGSSRPTTFVSGTQLTVELSAGDLAQPGNPGLTVSNASEGNWTSNEVKLSISAGVPTLSGMSPTSATAGTGPITLSVTGSSFGASSVVQVNGSARTTTFVSSTQLTATLTAADLANAGLLSITVTTPSVGTSGSLTFTVNNGVPSLSSLSPAGALVGSSGFTLTVNGGNFVSTSVVQVNGSARTTTFVSATRVTAAIPSSDLTTAGNLAITVSNPAPGGGTSTALNLAVNNPVPVITSVSPNPVIAAGSGFTLTVNGTGFVRSSVVLFDGKASPTTFVNATQLTVNVSGGTGIGSHTVNVVNPAPGGGTSNSASVNVVSLLGELFTPYLGGLSLPLEAQSESFASLV